LTVQDAHLINPLSLLIRSCIDASVDVLIHEECEIRQETVSPVEAISPTPSIVLFYYNTTEKNFVKKNIPFYEKFFTNVVNT